MTHIYEAVWLTLAGLSLLFVGGFVLWVYGAQTAVAVSPPAGPEAEATRKFHTDLVQWFFLYGVVVVLSGITCLISASVMIF